MPAIRSPASCGGEVRPGGQDRTGPSLVRGLPPDTTPGALSVLGPLDLMPRGRAPGRRERSREGSLRLEPAGSPWRWTGRARFEEVAFADIPLLGVLSAGSPSIRRRSPRRGRAPWPSRPGAWSRSDSSTAEVKLAGRGAPLVLRPAGLRAGDASIFGEIEWKIAEGTAHGSLHNPSREAFPGRRPPHRQAVRGDIELTVGPSSVSGLGEIQLETPSSAWTGSLLPARRRGPGRPSSTGRSPSRSAPPACAPGPGPARKSCVRMAEALGRGASWTGSW